METKIPTRLGGGLDRGDDGVRTQ